MKAMLEVGIVSGSLILVGALVGSVFAGVVNFLIIPKHGVKRVTAIIASLIFGLGYFYLGGAVFLTAQQIMGRSDYVWAFISATLLSCYLFYDGVRKRNEVRDEDWERALKEVNDRQFESALWAECLAKSSGIEQKASALYLKKRSEKLADVRDSTLP